MSNWGGARPGAGRKKRMTEEEQMEKLSIYEPVAFEAFGEKLKEKDMEAIKLFFKYYLGEPVKRVENKIEGNISGLTVEVINGLKNDEANNTDKQGL